MTTQTRRREPPSTLPRPPALAAAECGPRLGLGRPRGHANHRSPIRDRLDGAVAVVKPFSAVRYDEEAAGPLASLVAPPYDVISPSERDQYRSRSPYNVVHLTLPDSEDEAARRWREWLDSGVLVREEHSAVWELEQDFDGPDGYKRTRRGIVASLQPVPYENGAVLPHERTHTGPKEDRLRLLRAVGAQLEPILLLYEGP